jgi:hypothetical protein
VTVAAGGTVTGELIAGDTSSISGVVVLLCRDNGTGCTTDPALQATSDSSGQFQIDNVKAGTYFVLYAMPGRTDSLASPMTIDITDQSASCLGEAFEEGIPPSCSGDIPFGDDTGLRLAKGGTVDITLSNSTMSYSLDTGTICSPKYGLCLDFVSGDPLSVDVSQGASSDVQVTVRSI